MNEYEKESKFKMITDIYISDDCNKYFIDHNIPTHNTLLKCELSKSNELHRFENMFTSITIKGKTPIKEKHKLDEIKSEALNMLNSHKFNDGLSVEVITDARNPAKMISQGFNHPEYGCFARKKFHHNDLVGVLYGTLYSEREWQELTKLDNGIYCYSFDFDLGGKDELNRMNIVHKSKTNELGYIQASVIENQNRIVTENYDVRLIPRNANVSIIQCYIDKYIPMNIYVAKTKIRIGEEIVADLGAEYWKEKYSALVSEYKEMEIRNNYNKLIERGEKLEERRIMASQQTQAVTEKLQTASQRLQIQQSKKRIYEEKWSEIEQNKKKRKFKINPNEDRVYCAFEPHHTMKRDKLIWHHTTCPFRNEALKYMSYCSINPEHIFKNVDLVEHYVKSCPDAFHKVLKNKRLPEVTKDQIRKIGKKLLESPDVSPEEKERIKIEYDPDYVYNELSKIAFLPEPKIEVKPVEVIKKRLHNDDNDNEAVIYMNFIRDCLLFVSANIPHLVNLMFTEMKMEIPLVQQQKLIPPTIQDHEELNKIFTYFRIVLDYYEVFEDKYELSCRKDIETACKIKMLFTEESVVIPNVSEVMNLLMRIYNRLEEAYRT